MWKKTTFCCLVSMFTLLILSGCTRRYIRIQNTNVSLQDKLLLVEERLPIQEDDSYAYVPFTLVIRRSGQDTVEDIFDNTNFGKDSTKAFGLYEVTREQNRIVQKPLISDTSDFYIYDANPDSSLKTFFDTKNKTAEYESTYSLNTSQIKEKMVKKDTTDKLVMRIWKNEPDYVERSLVFVFKKGSLKVGQEYRFVFRPENGEEVSYFFRLLNSNNLIGLPIGLGSAFLFILLSAA